MTTTGIPKELLGQYQQLAQQQMQALYSNSTQFQHQKWEQAFKNPFNRLKKFFRINEVVEYNEGQEVIEPLDILRLKVAEWLYN